MSRTPQPSVRSARRVRRRRWRRPSFERVLLGVCIGSVALALLVVVRAGWDFYRLPWIERIYSEERDLYGTTGSVGLACGVIAFGLLASNFGYFVRRHLSPMKHVGTLRLWLDWHVISAVSAAGFVALHANFTVRNWLVRTCVYALGVAIVTGLVGRYLLRFVPRSPSGVRMSSDEFSDALYDLVDDVRADLVHDPAAVQAMEGLVAELDSDREIATLRHMRERLRECKQYIGVMERAMRESDATGAQHAREMHRRMSRLATQAAVVHWAGRMMDSWRALHRTFALLLLFAMVTHVVIAVYYGYGAVWR